MLGKYVNFSIGLGIFGLIAAGIGQWLQISPGSLVDWAIAISSFWWLLAIVTIPWNIYFEARETIAEAQVSREKNLEINSRQISYVQKVARWSLLGAIALHLVSAIALYLLAATGISNVGYVSSGLTLLLTILRPAIRGYEYLNDKLSTIKKEIKYPREDVIALKNKVAKIETSIRNLETKLNPKNPDSFFCQQQQATKENRSQLAYLKVFLEELEAQNAIERGKLAKEAQNAIAQLNEDSQFLGHVREIIRFVKTA